MTFSISSVALKLGKHQTYSEDKTVVVLGHRYSQQVQAPGHEEGIPEVPTIVDVAIRSESNGALYVTQFTLVRPCVRRETSQTSRCSYPMCKPLHPMILQAQGIEFREMGVVLIPNPLSRMAKIHVQYSKLVPRARVPYNSHVTGKP
ncbi:hypothetical protein VNO77_15678 [Canavalia gladiata]|uniref:Uncharacterized protein n=1 Tax=Canavalia gladiata TaxID=3824 RepID=A0AAN9M482_CANGL